jgi:peptide/nickel transport system permease protein
MVAHHLLEILPNLTASSRQLVGTVCSRSWRITLPSSASQGANWNWADLFWAQSQGRSTGAWWWFVPAGLAIALLGPARAAQLRHDMFVNPRRVTAAAKGRREVRHEMCGQLHAGRPRRAVQRAAGARDQPYPK